MINPSPDASQRGREEAAKGIDIMFDIEKLGFISCVDFSTIDRIDHFPPVDLQDGCIIDDVTSVVDDNGKVYVIGYLIAEGDALEFVFDVAANQLVSLEAWVTVDESIINQLDAAIKTIVAQNGIKAEMHYIPM